MCVLFTINTGMRRINIAFFICVCSLLIGCHGNEPVSKSKVIIDSDMVESFDDGIGYMLLAKNPHVDIVGITTVTGNTWSPEGLAYAVRLGELAHLSGTQYIQGAIEPLRPHRLDDLNGEIDANPGTDAYWRGAIGYPQINDWETFLQFSLWAGTIFPSFRYGCCRVYCPAGVATSWRNHTARHRTLYEYCEGAHPSSRNGGKSKRNHLYGRRIVL